MEGGVCFIVERGWGKDSGYYLMVFLFVLLYFGLPCRVSFLSE